MLYIMRHGTTKWNEERKLQGQTDIPLNENGIQLARKARKEYKDVTIDICFCSPLIRAKDTAKIFLEDRNIPIIFDDRLKEISFGEYEGTCNLYDSKDPNMNAFFHNPESYKAIKGAESFEELFYRTGDFLSNVVNPLLAEGKNILIVGHGAMNSSIVCQVKGLPLSQFWELGIENCKLYQLL